MKTLFLLLILLSGCVTTSGDHTVLRPDWLFPERTRVNVNGSTKKVLRPDWLFSDRYRVQDWETGRYEAVLRSDWLFPDRYKLNRK